MAACADTGWHGSSDDPDDGHDTSEPDHYAGHVKIAMYLEPRASREPGSLRLAAGTHAGERQKAINEAARARGIGQGDDVRATRCLA